MFSKSVALDPLVQIDGTAGSISSHGRPRHFARLHSNKDARAGNSCNPGWSEHAWVLSFVGSTELWAQLERKYLSAPDSCCPMRQRPKTRRFLVSTFGCSPNTNAIGASDIHLIVCRNVPSSHEMDSLRCYRIHVSYHPTALDHSPWLDVIVSLYWLLIIYYSIYISWDWRFTTKLLGAIFQDIVINVSLRCSEATITATSATCANGATLVLKGVCHAS